jgi:hypothetical protein
MFHGEEPVPNRENVPFRMTALLLSSIVAALVGTILLAAAWYNDTHHPQIPGQPPPPSHATLDVTASFAAVAWAAVIIAACRDQIIRHIDAATAQVIAHTNLYGDQREQEGVFEGMNLQARKQPPPPTAPPPPPTPAGPSAGGQVLPFPRSSSPGDGMP